MKTSDFFYELPEELIAQTPIEPRNSSKLMILNKKTGEIQHRIFSDLTSSISGVKCKPAVGAAAEPNSRL